MNNNSNVPIRDPRLPPAAPEAILEMATLRSEKHSVGRKLSTILCGEGNVGQLFRLSHSVEAAPDLCQLCFVRIFAQGLVGRDVSDLLNPCGAQESAVVPQELPHVAWVGRILLVEEELRRGVPSPFQGWVVDVEEQLILVVVQQLLGLALMVSEPRIRRL